MIELIPNPQERRDGVIRDHVLELLENLHRRIRRVERGLGISEKEAGEFERRCEAIRQSMEEGTLSTAILALGQSAHPPVQTTAGIPTTGAS